MKKSLMLFAFSFLFAASIFCQEEKNEEPAKKIELSENSQKKEEQVSDELYKSKIFGAENLLIEKFNIEGLKRTKRSYMDSLLDEFLGKPVTVQTIKLIETKLQAQNLFDQIQVSAKTISKDKASIDISFKEKWSFLPLPFGYYSDGAYAIGLFIMDMNALGQHCMATVGGLYSSSSVMGVGMFQKPPAQKGKLGFSVSGSVSKSKHELANAKNYKVFEYENFFTGLQANLLFKPTNSTHASLGTGYSFLNPIDSPHISRTNQWSLSASWGISSSSWNGYFLSTNSLSVGGSLLFSDNSKQYFAQTLTINGQFQKAIVSRLRFMVGARGFFSNDLYVTNYVGRAQSGVSMFTKYFSTDQIFGAYSGFETALVKGKIGMLSLYALYEVAMAKDWDKSFYICSGPEAGLRFYFAKLAFPAFAMGASYNINEKGFMYSISGGASF